MVVVSHKISSIFERNGEKQNKPSIYTRSSSFLTYLSKKNKKSVENLFAILFFSHEIPQSKGAVNESGFRFDKKRLSWEQ